MIAATLDPGSFRDPGGQVFLGDSHVYRTVNPPAVDDFDFVEASGLIDALVADGLVLASDKVDSSVLGQSCGDARYVIEHPKLPFISYPYEWTFSALKAAALLHMDIHLKALEHGVTLSDASAFNVQFNGAKPVFIDRLSFVKYRDGEIWAGHGQFCEQFLNPLLLRAFFGIPHNAWYRGAQEGIPTEAIRALLPVRRMLSWNVLTHIVLQSAIQSRVKSGGDADSAKSHELRKVGLPKTALESMLRRLRRWIATLTPADKGKTTWQDYANNNSYADAEAAMKRGFVERFVTAGKPKTVWDLGCNTGAYSAAALSAGADYVVGFDFDQGALEHGFRNARENDLPMQMVYLDAANPASDQGWAEAERQGLHRRASADALLALAFVHHLAIAKNIPLDRVVGWLVGLAPTGVIEFVPKTDPMVQRLLQFRPDIFPDYHEENFLRCVGSLARIEQSDRVAENGRLLISYDRRG